MGFIGASITPLKDRCFKYGDGSKQARQPRSSLSWVRPLLATEGGQTCSFICGIWMNIGI